MAGRGQRKWIYYESRQGRNKVADDLKKAGLEGSEVDRLQAVMERVADGRTRQGDVKDLGAGLLEVRATGNRRELRLLYCDDVEGPVLLALHVFVKKRQKTPAGALRTARDRLKDWQNRQA